MEEDKFYRIKEIMREDFNFIERTCKISEKNKQIFKPYIDKCKKLVEEDIKIQIGKLEGANLFDFLKQQNNVRNIGSLADIYDNEKNLKKGKIRVESLDALIMSVICIEEKFNTKIADEVDFE